LRQQDLELLHRIWLQVTSDPEYSGLHHYHIVALALQELERELQGPQRAELLAELRRQLLSEMEPPLTTEIPPQPSDGKR
jgi:hypothetical protein